MILKELRLWLATRPRILGAVKELTPAQKAMVEKWKRRIAMATDVPPEAIDEEVAQRWLTNWMKALIKKEYWKAAGLE